MKLKINASSLRHDDISSARSIVTLILRKILYQQHGYPLFMPHHCFLVSKLPSLHTHFIAFSFVFLLFHQLTTKASSRRFFFIFISISRELFHFKPSATLVVFLLHHRSCSKTRFFFCLRSQWKNLDKFGYKFSFFDDWKLNLFAWIYALGNCAPVLYSQLKQPDGD